MPRFSEEDQVECSEHQYLVFLTEPGLEGGEGQVVERGDLGSLLIDEAGADPNLLSARQARARPTVEPRFSEASASHRPAAIIVGVAEEHE